MSANFVKYDLGQLDAGSVVEVTLAHRANVFLLDASGFSRYQRGEQVRLADEVTPAIRMSPVISVAG